MDATAAPTEASPISTPFLIFLIVISIVVIAFIISLVIWGFWKYRKIKRREIERCSNCRCDTLKEHERCRSCDIPPTEDELREAEENLIYSRCPCIPPWRSRITKIAVNGGPPEYTERDHVAKTSLSHAHNGSRTNGVAKKNNAKPNGNAAILKRNSGVGIDATPVKSNGAVPKGDGVLEDLSEDNQRGKTGDKSAHNDAPSSPERANAQKEADAEEGDASVKMSARESGKQSSNAPPAPSTGPSKSSTHREKITPTNGEDALENNSTAANGVPPLELKGLNEESSDMDRGRRKKTAAKAHEDSYESSEEDLSTPRKPTVIHIGKAGVTIGGSNDEGASTPRIKIGGNGSISLGNSTISLGGTGASSQISLGNHLGGSTITIGGGDAGADGKLAPQVLRIGSRSSRRSSRYDGKFHNPKSRHHSYSGRSSTGSRCSTQISFSNGMTLVLDEEEGERESPRGQTQRSKIRRRHESRGDASMHRYPNGWSRQSGHGRHASTSREHSGSYHHHHRHGTKIHPYRSYATRDGHSPTAGQDRKIHTMSQQPDQSYSPRR